MFRIREHRGYPWSIKNPGDWAFALGINQFIYHTYAHKPLGDEYRPGMTMGPYGVHWNRGQARPGLHAAVGTERRRRGRIMVDSPAIVRLRTGNACLLTGLRKSGGQLRDRA